VTLTAASGGVFEVTVDGALLYSKRQTGVFPDEQALLAQLRAIRPQPI
jgi:selT/selW/selH-like putative selenoprotein